jgi:aminopeptidase N
LLCPKATINFLGAGSKKMERFVYLTLYRKLFYPNNLALKMKKSTVLTFLLFFILRPCFADTYPKNPNIDIRHYRFELQLSDENDAISGKASITAFLKKENIRTLRFDLINKNEAPEGKGMEVASVTLNAQALTFTHEKDVLLIQLPVPSKVNQELTVSIQYQGIPASGLKIAPNKYGDRTFFSDNWPNRARHWLPTVDHPYDKATSEMIITAPAKYQVISNGLLMEESNLEDGLKRTHWKQSVPIACWLYVLGAAEFAVQYVDTFEGKSIQTWVYKQDRDAGFYDFAVPTKHCLDFFSDYVGPFVYEKLANIQSNSVGGGMEAASAILYGDNSVTGDRSVRWRNVIIHEVAHQWFGNAVTEYDWDDVWLSEGFATYFTLLFREHAYGREDFVTGLLNAKKRVFNFYQNNKDYRIVHDNLSDMTKVTTGQTYQKGAWILHMLRDLVGDEPFKTGIQNYYTRYMNGHATTSDFRREMEKASSLDLEAFFQQWLYGGGNIVLHGSWAYDEEKKEVVVKLEQVQDDGFLFTFPIEFGWYGEGDVQASIVRKNVEGEKATFRFSVESKPDKVVIDPRTVLLAQWSFEEKNED